MALTKEQLIAPRYKVIADWPKSIYPVGTIINAGGRSEDLLYCDFEGPRCRDYPHLFRKLEWWEERKLEEMPEYVSYDNIIIKPKHFMNSWGKPVHTGCTHEGRFHTYRKCIPATIEEYNQYIKQQSKQ